MPAPFFVRPPLGEPASRFANTVTSKPAVSKIAEPDCTKHDDASDTGSMKRLLLVVAFNVPPSKLTMLLPSLTKLDSAKMPLLKLTPLPSRFSRPSVSVLPAPGLRVSIEEPAIFKVPFPTLINESISVSAFTTMVLLLPTPLGKNSAPPVSLYPGALNIIAGVLREPLSVPTL